MILTGVVPTALSGRPSILHLVEVHDDFYPREREMERCFQQRRWTFSETRTPIEYSALDHCFNRQWTSAEPMRQRDMSPELNAIPWVQSNQSIKVSVYLA